MLTLERLQGQEIYIESLNLEKQDHKLTLFITVNCKEQTCDLTFRNVSSLNVRDFSYPLQISGFEVIDHLINGWQSDVKYRVHDFEDGILDFYCEEIEISE